MLTSFEKMSGDKLQRYEYSYNKDGLRTVKRYFEDGILQTETVYIWKDGILIGANVADENGISLFSVKYVYNGEELVAINLNGYVLLVEKNLQGDITSLYDVVNEEKLYDFYYDAYGKMSVSQENSFIVTIIKALIVVCANVAYRGYYYDFDTGLYYLQSRYYDPQTGRFISLDDTQIAIASAGEPIGANLYVYCYNNPVNNSDPTGCDPRTVSGSAYGYNYSGIFTALRTPKTYRFNVYVNNRSYFCNFVLKMATGDNNYRYGCISFWNRQDNLSYLFGNHMTKTLAYSFICLANKIKSNSLQTRSVDGLAFEIVVHYIFYKFGIMKNHTETSDCGHTKIDSNAAIFEKYKSTLKTLENLIRIGDYKRAIKELRPLRTFLKW